MRNKILMLIIASFLVYIFIPDSIHFITRKLTEDKLIKANRFAYNDLAIKINNMSDDDSPKKLLLERRDSLYLWFDVRGIGIDEGHESITLNEKWREIIVYYVN